MSALTFLRNLHALNLLHALALSMPLVLVMAAACCYYMPSKIDSHSGVVRTECWTAGPGSAWNECVWIPFPVGRATEPDL